MSRQVRRRSSSVAKAAGLTLMSVAPASRYRRRRSAGPGGPRPLPELQDRGLLPTSYAGTTLRENFYEKGQTRLRDDHPGARYRRQ